MKLYYHKDPLKNFGDDLNPWLWNRLLPGIFDGKIYHDPKIRQSLEKNDPLFIGIGTLLNEHIPTENVKVIFGTGTGYGKKPNMRNATIYCVRGPLTAKALGLPKKYAVTDSAALIKSTKIPKVDKIHSISYMPHCSSAREGGWKQVCADIEVNYIDPSFSVEQVLSELLASELLITEAMHGAIIADVLRIPWIAVKTQHTILDFKWIDWCKSLSLEYRPTKLTSLWRSNNNNLIDSIKKNVKIRLARHQLSDIVQNTRPSLSSTTISTSRFEQLEELLEEFKNDFKNGMYE